MIQFDPEYRLFNAYCESYLNPPITSEHAFIAGGQNMARESGAPLWIAFWKY